MLQQHKDACTRAVTSRGSLSAGGRLTKRSTFLSPFACTVPTTTRQPPSHQEHPISACCTRELDFSGNKRHARVSVALVPLGPAPGPKINHAVGKKRGFSSIHTNLRNGVSTSRRTKQARHTLGYSRILRTFPMTYFPMNF
ncbi:unnamed protein product, partial [Ectocarpus sp. 12 AP-2014]